MIPSKVQEVLEANGLAALEFEPGSTPTVEMAAARIGVAEGQIAKSLLFKGKSGRLALILCAGDRRIPSRKLKDYFGEKMSMTDSDETYALTGFKPGGVCPFGVRDIPVYLDESLSAWETVYPAAGNDATGVPVAPEKLMSITGGQLCSLSEARSPAGRGEAGRGGAA